MDKMQAFLAAVFNNEQLTKELESATNKQQYMNIAKAHGFYLTEQDLETINKMVNAYEKQQAGEPLSENELELVAGGIFTNKSPKIPGLW